MRYPVTATFLIAGLFAGSANAALRTKSMDAVEAEVRARDAALTGDLDKARKKAKKLYAKVLKQFAKDSTGRKQDHKRITKITKILTGRPFRDDAALHVLLTQGVSGFMLELEAVLRRADRQLGLLGTATGDSEKALARLGKAHDAFDAAVGRASLMKILKKCVRADALAAKMRRSADAAIALNGPIDVHRFQYDIGTDEYIVVGGRVSQAQVDRDLAGSLCTKCHTDAVHDVKDSVHYTVRSPSQQVLFPGGGEHGMFDRACGLPATTGLTNYMSDVNMGECAKCHVGRYMPAMEGFFAGMFQEMGVSDPQGQATKLIDSGLDCLICHSREYKSRPTDGTLAEIAPVRNPDARSPTPVGFARDGQDNADFDRDGTPDLVIDMNGDGTPDAPLMVDMDGDGTPETPWRTVAQDRSLDALRSIGVSTDHACLRCHEHDFTGYKRGALWIEGHDFHQTEAEGPFAGAENTCTVCHETDAHKIKRGHSVGGDFFGSDYPAPPPGTPFDPNDTTDVSCRTCHTASALPGTIHTDTHLAKMACETCHITAGAGITYSLFGQGGQLSFGRNAEGKDTKLLVSDAYITDDEADLVKDWEAYRTLPILAWFDGGASFLAQPLAARGTPNAKIAPFKPMANGIVFDARFFSGQTATNEAGYAYNAYSMYRFYANGRNAEAFDALGMLDMTPTEVRNITMDAFYSPDPAFQAMGLMLIFPNLVYFDKAAFGYEHYLTHSQSPYDRDHDGLVDAGADLDADMFAAANAGLRQFQGFNGPMGFAADYEWYPPFEDVSETISMKLPDGSLIKMFMAMKGSQIQDPDQRAAFMAAIDNYPAFSQVTLGGHAVRPKEQAIGDCGSCHSAGGLMSHTVPVTRKVPVDMGPMGTIEFPLYQWKFYNVKALVNLGLSTTSEDVVAGTADVDIDGDTRYLRVSDTQFALNWFAPNAANGYRAADEATALLGTTLAPADLTWHGGDWMPVLEPVVDLISNARVLGYGQDYVPMSPPAK